MVPAHTLAGTNSGAPYPVGYWEKGFHFQRQAVTTVIVGLSCQNTGEASQIIKNLLTDAGGEEQRRGLRFSMNSFSRQDAPKETVEFKLPHSTKTAKLARKLFHVCELERFQIQESDSGSEESELTDRIGELDREMTANQQCLASMPVAQALMTSKLNQMKATLAQFTREKPYDVVNVYLFSAAERPNP